MIKLVSLLYVVSPSFQELADDVKWGLTVYSLISFNVCVHTWNVTVKLSEYLLYEVLTSFYVCTHETHYNQVMSFSITVKCFSGAPSEYLFTSLTFLLASFTIIIIFRYIHTFCVTILLFLLLSSSPLHKCSTIYVYIHLLMSIWVVSRFWLLKIKLL